MKQGFLQSRIRLERKVEGDQAYLTLRVRRGPRVDIRFDGATPPQSVQDVVRTKWHRGVFDKQRADDGAEALARMADDRWLSAAEGRLRDRRTTRPTTARSSTRFRPDRTTTRWCWRSRAPPASIPTSSTRSSTSRNSSAQLFTDPLVVTELLARYYRDQGYLAAEIDEPRIEYQGLDRARRAAGARGSRSSRCAA